MKKYLAVLLLACTPVHAGPTDAEGLARELVTEIGPRFAGSANDARAVEWALRTLRRLGYQNVRAEPVSVPRWVRGPISVTLDGRALTAVALGGSVATPPSGTTAEVLRVESLQDLAARPLEQVKGKIVFFDRAMARSLDGSTYGAAVQARVRGPAEAGRRGAVAVLIRSIGTSGADVAHTGITRYDAAAPRVPAAALSNPAADALAAKLAAGPARVTLKLAARDEGRVQSANVIGEIPGTGAGIVLLGAHLDSWDITPGANDDASGVGIVMEAARRAAAAGPLRATLRVVLYANEEFGLDGARAYAKAHAAELPQHLLAVESDSGSGPIFRFQTRYPDAADPRIAQLTAALAPLNIPYFGNEARGGADLGPLREAGVPVLEFDNNALSYFDLHHTTADTVETLDSAGLRQNVEAFAIAARLAAQ